MPSSPTNESWDEQGSETVAAAQRRQGASFSFGSFVLPRRELQCEGFREGFSELACEPEQDSKFQAKPKQRERNPQQAEVTVSLEGFARSCVSHVSPWAFR